MKTHSGTQGTCTQLLLPLMASDQENTSSIPNIIISFITLLTTLCFCIYPLVQQQIKDSSTSSLCTRIELLALMGPSHTSGPVQSNTAHKQGAWKQTGSPHSFALFTKDGNYFGKDYIPYWLLISSKPSPLISYEQEITRGYGSPTMVNKSVPVLHPQNNCCLSSTVTRGMNSFSCKLLTQLN